MATIWWLAEFRGRIVQYRYEIDGVRAIAALSVTLFHFHFAYLSGGFLGVDIFFVISGYLITKLIVQGVEKDSFRVSGFYANRAVRILPALFATILITWICSVLFLTAGPIEEISRESFFSALSVSNIYFYFEAGYFDADAITKPLLHTWSLGVEEQFYLFWPFIFLLFKRTFARFALLTAIFLASLFASHWLLSVDASAAFYLMPFRAWEFAVGAGAFFLERKWSNSREDSATHKLIGDVGYGVALLVLGVCFVVYDETVPFPGLYALPPVLATGIIMWLRPGPVFRLILANPVSRYLGRISYSTYLVHWPLVCFLTMLAVMDMDAWQTSVFMLVTTLVLASLLYFGVEKPFRTFRNKVHPGSIGFVAMAAMLALVIPTMTAWRTPESFAGKRDAQIVELEGVLGRAGDRRLEAIDRITANQLTKPDTDTTVLVIGDSLAEDVFLMLATGYTDVRVLRETSNGCRPLIGYVNPADRPDKRQRCTAFMDAAMEAIRTRSDIDHVVIESWWMPDTAAMLDETVREIRQHVPSVYVVTPRVRLGASMDVILQSSHTMDDVRDTIARLNQSDLSREIWEALSRIEGVNVLDIRSIMCGEAGVDACANWNTDIDMPVLYDAVHVALPGARFVGAQLRAQAPDRFTRQR